MSVSLFLLWWWGHNPSVEGESTKGQAINKEEKWNESSSLPKARLCCNPLSLPHSPGFSPHHWWLVTVTRGWTVVFQEVTGLNPFSGLMKPPGWSENCLVSFSPTWALKDLSEFFYKEYFTIKLLFSQIVTVKTKCSLIHYKCGTKERLQSIMRYQHIQNQFTMKIRQLLCLSGSWCL